MTLHIVLLAAGNSSRYGGLKQRALVDGVSMLRRAAQAALATGASVLAVTGAHEPEIAAELAGLPLRLVHNANWEQGMGGSVGCAFRQLADSTTASAAIICMADQPLVGSTQLQRLIDAHASAPGKIIAANHGAALGPPCLFPQRYFAELAQLSGPKGARPVLERHADQVDSVPMPEAAMDIDTPEDYQRLLAAGQQH